MMVIAKGEGATMPHIPELDVVRADVQMALAYENVLRVYGTVKVIGKTYCFYLKNIPEVSLGDVFCAK